MRANGGRLAPAKLSSEELKARGKAYEIRRGIARKQARRANADRAAGPRLYDWYQSLIDIHLMLGGPKAYNLCSLSADANLTFGTVT